MQLLPKIPPLCLFERCLSLVHCLLLVVYSLGPEACGLGLGACGLETGSRYSADIFMVRICGCQFEDRVRIFGCQQTRSEYLGDSFTSGDDVWVSV